MWMTLWASIIASPAPPPAEAWIRVAPAESLRISRTGDGTPVVLIPGLFGSAYTYRRVAPLLAEAGYEAIIIEPIGIGGSSRPRGADYSLTAQAARVAAALDSLRTGPVVVVGHAITVSIALRLALRRPDLVSGVVSLEGGLTETIATPGFRRAMSFAPWIKLLGGMRLLRGQIRRGLVNSSADPSWVTDETVAGYTVGAAADLDAALLALIRMAESRERDPLEARLNQLRCPVLLVLGAAPHSSAPPERQVAAMRRLIPAFAVDSVAGVGHFIQEERPAAVVAAVAAVRAMGGR